MQGRRSYLSTVELPEGQDTPASLPGTLTFILRAYKSVEDLFLFHVRGGKRETCVSPTRLSIFKIRR